jgi:alpha-D-xyloside xylohydrolase
VYKGKDGTFTLYEDENNNYNYERGNYANITFTYNDAKGTLNISKRSGQFNGMLTNRTFIIVTISKDTPKAFNYDAEGQNVTYNGSEQTVVLK